MVQLMQRWLTTAKVVSLCTEEMVGVLVQQTFSVHGGGGEGVFCWGCDRARVGGGSMELLTLELEQEARFPN
jgi:hypothetical protein